MDNEPTTVIPEIVRCKLCGLEGMQREGGRIPAGWRTFNNNLAHGPVCPMCWGPHG